jgi:hypothetical protein
MLAPAHIPVVVVPVPQVAKKALAALGGHGKHLDCGPDGDTLSALLSALRWSSAVLLSGPGSAHRAAATVVSTVVLRILKDGFPLVGVDGKLKPLSWLSTDEDESQTLLWDVDKVRVCARCPLPFAIPAHCPPTCTKPSLWP